MENPQENLPQKILSEPFASQKPVELELGMGRSHFLFERASLVPEHNLIGIEWKKEWVRQAHKKRVRDNIPNVWPVHGNAWDLFAQIPDASLDAIVVNFPDPWWKKRHQKRRILNEKVVEILSHKMKNGAIFLLQTDVLALFECYFDLLSAHHALNLGALGENPLQAQSHREKKCLANGMVIHRAYFIKTK